MYPRYIVVVCTFKETLIAFTVICTTAVLPFNSARIDVIPGAFAVTLPLASTSAIEVLSLLQVGVPAGLPVAFNLIRAP